MRSVFPISCARSANQDAKDTAELARDAQRLPETEEAEPFVCAPARGQKAIRTIVSPASRNSRPAWQLLRPGEQSTLLAYVENMKSLASQYPTVAWQLLTKEQQATLLQYVKAVG